MNYSPAEINAMNKQLATEISEEDVERYVQTHTGASPWFSEQEAVAVGCSRYQTILDNYRLSLSGRFTEVDIQILLDVTAGITFCADSIEFLAIEFPVDCELASEPKGMSHKKMLCQKLATLSFVERVVLVDAVEQAWHRAYLPGKSIRDFFRTLEIELL